MRDSIEKKIAKKMSKANKNHNIYILSLLWKRWFESTSTKLGVANEDLERVINIDSDKADKITTEINGSVDLPFFLSSSRLLPAVLDTDEFCSFCELNIPTAIKSDTDITGSSIPEPDRFEGSVFYHHNLTSSNNLNFYSDPESGKTTLSKGDLLKAIEPVNESVSINWEQFDKLPIETTPKKVYLTIQRPFIINQTEPCTVAMTSITLGSIYTTLASFYRDKLNLSQVMYKRLGGAVTSANIFNLLNAFEDEYKLEGITAKILKASNYDSIINLAAGGIWDKEKAIFQCTVFHPTQIQSMNPLEENPLYDCPPKYTTVLYQQLNVNLLIHNPSILRVAKILSTQGVDYKEIEVITGWKKSIVDIWSSNKLTSEITINPHKLKETNGKYSFNGLLREVLIPCLATSMYSCIGTSQLNIEITPKKNEAFQVSTHTASGISSITIISPSMSKAAVAILKSIKILIDKVEDPIKPDDPLAVAFYEKQYTELSLLINHSEDNNLRLRASATKLKKSLSNNVLSLINNSSTNQVLEYFKVLKNKIDISRNKNILINNRDDSLNIKYNFNTGIDELTGTVKYPKFFLMYSICSRPKMKTGVYQLAKAFLEKYSLCIDTRDKKSYISQNYTSICIYLGVDFYTPFNEPNINQWAKSINDHLLESKPKPAGFDFFIKVTKAILYDLSNLGITTATWDEAIFMNSTQNSSFFDTIDFSSLDLEEALT